MQFSTPYKLHLYLPTPTRTSQFHLYPPPVLKNFFVFKRFSCFSTTASNLGHTEATFSRWIRLVDFLIWCVSSFVSPFFLLDYKAPNFEEGWRMNYILGVSVAACICTVFLIVLCTVKLYARNNPTYRNLQSATK